MSNSTDHMPNVLRLVARPDPRIFGASMVGSEPAPKPRELNRKMRSYASILSYNDPAPIPAVKHLLLEGASRIEELERRGIAKSEKACMYCRFWAQVGCAKVPSQVAVGMHSMVGIGGCCHPGVPVGVRHSLPATFSCAGFTPREGA